MVREWRKKKAALLVCPRQKKAFRKCTANLSELENELKDWILQLRMDGNVVTRNMVRVKALRLKKGPKFKDILGIDLFKASAGWCTNFMNRESLTLRLRTKISQKLLAMLEDKVQLESDRQHG